MSGLDGELNLAAPWYWSKTEPFTLDMLITLRHQIITARFLLTTSNQTQYKVLEVQHAWAMAAALS
jgi:hypothetical protein